MRYFLDTEFIESKDRLDLISIGIVAHDGRELYLENSEVEWSRASEWVLKNVKPHLSANGAHLFERHIIQKEIERFVDPPSELTRFGNPNPEFWGYYSSWDWTALCWLMGGMLETPRGWPMFCRDLRQALDERGLQHIKQPDDARHHALDDARWAARCHAEHIAQPQPA